MEEDSVWVCFPGRAVLTKKDKVDEVKLELMKRGYSEDEICLAEQMPLWEVQ